DVVIVNGDGLTEPYEGDVLIDGDRIVQLGDVTPSVGGGAERVIEGGGRVLAPGFVDTHNHGALGGTRIGDHGIPITCEMALRGGVTKRICGSDGLSPAPVPADQRHEYAAQLMPLDGSIGEPWTWSSVAEFLAWHRGRSVTDMGIHLGHSAVRRTVMGNLAQVADDQQLRDMCEVVRREAPLTLGLSTGLVYNPAVYCDRRELTLLVSAFNDVKPGALFPHLRSESDEIITALNEVLIPAFEGGGGYCNEHSKIAGRHNWDKYNDLVGLIDETADFIPTMENMYPYPAGSTTGDAIFPPEVRAGLREEFLARLGDPAARRSAYERMRGDTKTWDNFVAFCGGLEGVQIAGVRAGVGDEFLGKRLGDVARTAGEEDLDSFAAHEAVFDFFVANRGEITIITHYGNDATVERFFRRPTMAICTDGLMPGPGQKPHPRSIGSFPKALRMARELDIPLQEIVHRMSVLPCRFLGLEDPVLQPGADASLVLFDAENVREANSFTEPLIPPEGIDAVWVHGDLVYADGTFRPPSPFGGRILTSPARKG
ncbi:MAG: amidohydrolase family protein, partial [Acidimicrobiia bacterium]|nr:amidohydrolase family protein [Acidimicrobiia bacterium]